MLRDDPERELKIWLLQEVCGAALLGRNIWLPQPKAIILHGRSANNGKTEYLSLLEGLAGGASHVAPHQFDDRNVVIALRGQKLNIANELTSSQAIASEIFKSAIRGDTIHGKSLWKDVVEFKPVAQHVFAANRLPTFAGSLDRGCRRRLLVIEFLTSIPVADMIPDIASKILEEEYQLLLNWAVVGASRLIAQKGFTVPPSSDLALENWIQDTDPVGSWIKERVRPAEDMPSWPGYKPTDALDEFYEWAIAAHYDKNRLPMLAEFTHRMIELFPQCKRTATSNRFKGITIMSSDASDTSEPAHSNGSARGNFMDWALGDPA